MMDKAIRQPLEILAWETRGAKFTASQADSQERPEGRALQRRRHAAHPSLKRIAKIVRSLIPLPTRGIQRIFPWMGIQKRLCSGVFIGENAHTSQSAGLRLREKC